MVFENKLLWAAIVATAVGVVPITGRAAVTSNRQVKAVQQTSTSVSAPSKQSQVTASKRSAAPVKASQTATSTAKATNQRLTLTGMKVTKTTVRGHTVAGATVQAMGVDHAHLGTAVANRQGNFTLTSTAPLTQLSFEVRATKPNAQAVTWRYVAKLKVTNVKVAKTTVKGRTTAGAKVTLVNQKQKKLASAVAATNGHFSLHVAKKVVKAPFKLKATRAHYHATSWQYAAPLKVAKVKVTKHRVTGHTTAGATVKATDLKKRFLGRAVANKKGQFTIKTAKKVSGKPFDVKATKRHYRKVTWKYTAPQKLTHLKVSGKTVRGRAAAHAKVKLRNAKRKVIGATKANAKGNFKLRAPYSLTTKTFSVKATRSRYRSASWNYKAKKLNVPLIAQRPELPTGCEITAVTMMLRYKGAKVTKSRLAREMPRSSNPNKGFVGNPYTSHGWTVYPAALMKVVRKHAHSAVNLTGVSTGRLKKQINKKHPVTLWVTGVDGFNTHALTMTGYSPTRIYYNDPWTNRKTSMKWASFKSHWKRDGYRALSY